MKGSFFALLSVVITFSAYGQRIINGKIFDRDTKEPLAGAAVVIAGTSVGTTTDSEGRFNLTAPENAGAIEISYLGYEKEIYTISQGSTAIISLKSSVSNLEQVIVTANREASLRTESPVAIHKISPALVSDTKPVLLAELINKVPGVVMLNYNNEQHAMSIRQPMATSPYFLYMEDGIPVRPMGIFNHNALIEMNIFSVSSVEVVKGPASSLYGPEAVGGAINFITHRPTAVPTLRLGTQIDQWGYRRLQYAGGGMITKKAGVYVGGFIARQRDAWQSFSDYDKSSFTARLDYSLTDNTKLTMSFSDNEYYSDMTGSVDSVAFYNRTYTSTTDFTYRKVHSQRTRLTAQHSWNDKNETTLTLFYRDNFIKQNPNYSIRWQRGSNTASGEINRNGFSSRGFLLQHGVDFNVLNTRLLLGGSVDYSPASYWAYRTDLEARLRPDGLSVERYILLSERPDDFIANYHATLVNSAIYSQVETRPFEKLKITAGLRYDRMVFHYNNYLDGSLGSKTYDQFTPKIGATYELSDSKGLYVNYSQGFSPPGLTAIFRKRPDATTNEQRFYYNLEPARFYNYEAGGWVSLFNGKVYADVAIYQMNGRRELLNIRQPDNSYDYQSAGKTVHRGVEYSVTFKQGKEWFVRAGGTNAIHRFTAFNASTRGTDAIKNLDGFDMPQSPAWIANAEVTYKPSYLPDLRLSLEWQRISSWYQDQVNRVKYDDRTFLGLRGVSVINFRTGYLWKNADFFVSILNLSNELYANSAVRSNAATDRTAFTPAAPRTFVMGVQYNFSGHSKDSEK